MRSIKMVIPYAKGDAEGKFLGIPCRSIHGGMTIPDFALGMPTKAMYHKLMPPVHPAVLHVMHENMNAHARHVKRGSSLERLFDKYRGKTALLVLSGPSARGVSERIAPWRDNPDFKVFTLNLSAHAVPDADFHCNFEKLCPAEYVAPHDPARTTLITTPMATKALARKWRGKNSFYAYLGDMLDPDNPLWEPLPLLASAVTTACPALQAVYFMGFSNVLVIGGDFCVTDVASDPDRPGLIAEGDFYFDGTRYYRDRNQAVDGHEKCYHSGEHMMLAYGVDGEPVGFTTLNHTFLMAVHTCLEVMEDAGRVVHSVAGKGLLDFNCCTLEDALTAALGVPQPAQEAA